MSDLIDRQAALAELDKAAWGKAWDKALAAEMLKSLPSAQQWIPCSERLPTVHEEVLVYLWENEYPYIAYVDVDGFWRTEDFMVEKDNEPLAWMPLPEPARLEEPND